MDFHTLSRKELQALSKKNKIPANITNVAMADALSALPLVEGLDEILNQREGDIGTPSVQIRSASRTTTQRKAVKEPETSKVSTRISRGTRTRVAEGVVEQENKDANVTATPAMVPSSRRRVPAVSTRRNKEVVEDGDDGKNGVQEKTKDVPKTPAVAPSSRKRVTVRSVSKKNETPSGTSVQKGYSTRRSVRLLGKSLCEMSLVDTEDMGLDKIDDVSEDLSGDSQHVVDSSNTEKGASMQTVSTVVSEELEVSSLNKADDEGQSHDLGSDEKFVSGKESDVEVELPAEGQSHDLGSEEKLVSGKESAVEDELQAEPQEEGSGETNNVEAEPIDSSLGSIDECGDSNEAGSELLPELENQEYNETTKQDDIAFEACEEASMEVADEKDVPSSEEDLENVADNANHIENVEPMHDHIDECGDSNEAGSELLPELKDSGDSANVENKECNETEQDAISFEACEEVSIEEFAVKKDDAEEVLENVADDNVNPIEAFEPMHDDIDEAADNKDVSSNEEVLENVSEEYVSHIENFEPCEAGSMEIADKKDVSSTEEVLENVADDYVNQIENFEPMHDDIVEAADNKDVLTTEGVIEVDVAVQLPLLGEQIAEDQKDISEKLEAEAQAEESQVAVRDDIVEAADNKDVLTIEGVVEVDDVAVQLPLLGGEQIAEDQKDISENLEAEAQAEESQVAVGDDTVIDDGNAFSSVADGTQISFSLQQVESNGISNTLVEADGETKVSSETMTVAQETKEIQTVTTLMKENLIADFQKMSIRGLKKKLKELDGKPKTMTDNGSTCMQEGEKKRTALQALPPNQLKTGEAKNDV